jgi:hypothetical protein
VKITTEDRAIIADLIAPHDTEHTRASYRAGRFPRADMVKDLDKRYRWDLFSVATHGRHDVTETLYAYLDDNHLDTALRSIVAPL